jgi:hypothetical protein
MKHPLITITIFIRIDIKNNISKISLTTQTLFLKKSPNVFSLEFHHLFIFME